MVSSGVQVDSEMTTKEQYPNVSTVKCHCMPKHSKNCGCLSDDFIKQAKLNFTQCLYKAECNKELFAESVLILGKYHSPYILHFL